MFELAVPKFDFVEDMATAILNARVKNILCQIDTNGISLAHGLAPYGMSERFFSWL